jgi:hypothetical protein
MWRFSEGSTPMSVNPEVTCNPGLMILFSAGSDPFRSANEVLYYDDTWTGKLFELISTPPRQTPLYRMLAQEGVVDAEAAKEYESLVDMRLFEEEQVSYQPPLFRFVATAGPYGQFPRLMGKTWTLENALVNKANLESKGYKIKLQSRTKGIPIRRNPLTKAEYFLRKYSLYHT